MDWDLVIIKLKDAQGKLAPGNGKRLDIESLIQSIRSDQLHGNYGHAQAFAEDPTLELRSGNRVQDKILSLLPDFKFPEDKIKNERE